MKVQKFPSRKELLKRLHEEPFKRVTLSFYRYIIIDEPEILRNELFHKWNDLNIFGRIYLAHEGINAQMSIPEANLEKFRNQLYSDKRFSDVPFKIAVEDSGKSFYKLIIKTRNKIVADGLKDEAFDVTNVGTHLSAEEWNQEMQKKNTIVVDMRNFYESEVGKFENAICPEAHSFRQELPMVKEILHGKENEKILLYCTGGIRCEKASAFLKHHGFKDVNQLHGGIIEYARQVKAKGLESKFKGKNFVFDERMGERITDEIISKCYQCETLCDSHYNCTNDGCHLLFIQCNSCKEKFEGCCSIECHKTIHLPVEEQKKIQRETAKDVPASVFVSRKRIKSSFPKEKS
ncbi:MAG: rhodanese-related sulfurtransferase [Bacteroidetes bacterium]|nr:rhodanese-related sulfurtransferase [Bacteroidota bacterium]